MTVLYLSLIGVVLGIVDVLPMIKKRLDKFSIISAFVFHLIMPWVVYDSTISIHSIVKGGVLYFVLSLPIVILVLRDDKKAVPIILCTSTVLGLVCGTIIHYFI